MVSFLSLTVFPLLLIVAGTSDALSMRIPNWLNALIAAAFFPMAFLTGMPLAEFGLHLGAGAAMFLLGFFLFAMGLWGGGDAKLLAAAGLWLGFPNLTAFLVVTGLAGGALALAVCAWAAINAHAEIQGGRISRYLGSVKPSVPYGYAFAIGGLLVFPQSQWMTGA